MIRLAASGGAPRSAPPAGGGPARAPRRREASTVLLIDADAVSRRFVELVLGREPDLEVESAVDGAGALEILARNPVHLIIAETDFGDMNGLQFYRRLSQESRLRGVPFLFFTADARVTTKVVALSAGVDDYVVKPCDGGELCARVRAALARHRRGLASLRARGYSLAGDLTALSFADLISILDLGKKSGVVSVATADQVGSVHFDQGRIVHAVLGNLMGPTAFVRLMAEEEGHFEFTPGRCTLPEPERTIRQSVQALMMDAARIIDTERANDGPLENTGEVAAIRIVTGESAARALARAPAFVPEAGVAAQLETAVRNGFALGDLHSFSADELARWTEAPAARERFHALLVADLARGVSALLALAGAPTERWVLSSLAPVPKAMGLAFFLRRERLVDLVLVDINAPAQFRASFRRAPSVVIVAPPEGDALALGTKARVELADLVAELRPRALLGIGNAAEEAAMATLAAGVRGAAPVPVRCLVGALGQPPTDLRVLLGEAIRLCAGLASTGGAP
jgi:CheY-like chemotaxis protein